MAFGFKPYKPALPLVIPRSPQITLALNSMGARAAKDPYVDNIRYTAPISNRQTQKAKPIIATMAYFNFVTTNNGKRRAK